MTGHWWRVIFTVPGYTPIPYEVMGEDMEEAYQAARWKHLGDSWNYNGRVDIFYLPDGPTSRDLSVEMDDLDTLAQELNQRHDGVPF